MTAAGPWSVKGIDPKAREMAKDLARRSGMTLGEWLNQMIIDGTDGDIAPPPFEDPGQSYIQRPAPPRGAAYRPEVREPGRRRLLDEMYREATFAQDAEAELRYEAGGRRIPERGYRDPASPEPARTDFGSAKFSRAEPAAASRSDDSELVRITRTLETLSSRLETAEHRSTLAISGIDQSVMGVLSRLDGLDQTQDHAAIRLEGAIDQVRDTQARVAERVRRMEQDDGSRVDALRALEGALSRLVGHIDEGTARADSAAAQVRDDVDSLGRRVNKIETGADAAAALLTGAGRTREELSAVERRVEAVEAAVAQAPDAYADAEKVETVLARLAERLERAEARTTAAVRSLETSFAGLDARLRTNESRARDTDVVGEIDRRFESLAADLSQKVDASRAELAERLRGAADAGKLGALEATLHDITGQVAQAERRSAQAIDRIGREVVTIAQSLGERVAGVEARNTAAVEHMGGEMTRISDAIDGRLKRADTTQAEALEKLGGEIARIAERLTERIAASDKRSADTLDAAAGRFARLTDTLSDRQDQTASDLTDRIRQSEERTAKLLDDAREKLEQQVQDLQRRSMREAALRAVEAAAPPPPPPQAYLAAAPVPTFEPARFAGQNRAPDWGAGPEASVSSDPFAGPADASAPPRTDVHDDPFAAPRAGFSAPFPAAPPAAPVASSIAAGTSIDADLIDSARMAGSPLRFEANPFDPDDDFQAPASGGSIFGPPPMSFQSSEAAQPELDGRIAAPEMEPFGQFSVRDFVTAPEADRPNSTRDMLDQARAAAKRAAGVRDGFKAAAVPAPALDAAEPRPFGVSFNGKLKKGGGSTLRTAGLASAWACAITVGAVGAYALAMKDGGGQGHGQVAEAPTAATPPAEETSDGSAKPQLSMALTSPSSTISHGSADAGASASAGPVSQAAAALTAGAKAPGAASQGENPTLTMAPHRRTPQTSAAPNPSPESEKTDPPLETARSLYDDSVRKIEAGDSGAVNDLKRAANLGFAPAQFYLGRLYEAGAAGLGKDMKEARRWTQRAAQGGDPAAMYNLASYLYAGDGGAKDPAGAVEWFRKAADRGVVNSQYNLAQLYETGHGVTQNLAEAYKWYLVAAAAGDPEAKANVETLKTKLPADARATEERTAAALHSQLEGSAHLAAAAKEAAAQ